MHCMEGKIVDVLMHLEINSRFAESLSYGPTHRRQKVELNGLPSNCSHQRRLNTSLEQFQQKQNTLLLMEEEFSV